MMEEKLVVKHAQIDLPKKLEKLQEIVCYVMRMPEVQSFAVSHEGIVVSRAVAENEAVLTTALLQIAASSELEVPPLSALSEVIDIEHARLPPGTHPLTQLLDLMRQVPTPTAWYVTRGDYLASWLGEPAIDESAPQTLCALPVYFVPPDELPGGKLLLVSSPTRSLTDADVAVIADIGGLNG